MTRRLWASVVFVGALVGVAVAGLVVGVRPVLGLDLEGGVSVILSAPEGTPREVMDRALESIRNRVDAFGVAEPQIFVTGTNIEVQLPGLARGSIVQRGGRFCVVSSAGKDLGCRETREQAQVLLQETGQERLLQLIGTTARLEQRQVLEVIPEGDPGFQETEVTCPSVLERESPRCSFQGLADKEVVYLDEEGTTKYRLGPVEVTGDAIRKATAVFRTASQTSIQAGWVVEFELTGAGSRTFAEVTTRLVKEPDPKNRLAIVLDRRVISAPRVQSAITGGVGEITGSFTEEEAKDLATVLNAGALPVELAKEQVVTVSPTLGAASLRQGLVAGLAGLALLAVYLLFYYRLLGAVTWVGLTAWAALAVGLVSLLGRTAGYSLTLAGVAGLVVSIGIAADSYIVFYERLKDEVRHGKAVRAAVVPAFQRSFRTILTADFVTVLAAVILYVVAVSSVRGFALTLGLATALDLFTVYFLKRPLVFLIARSPRLTNLRGFGLVSGVAAEPLPVEGGGR